MGQTAVEKIAQRHAVDFKGVVHAGDYLTIRPKQVMTHDNTGAVIPKFKSIGAPRVKDPRQPVFALDHDIQNRSESNLAKYEKIEAFAKEQGVDFYPAGTGIGHQVMVEQGYVLPGSLCVASDSHSNTYGALAAVGTPVVRTDAAVIWATGEFWWEVPPIAKVVLTGQLPRGCQGKDVIVTLCGLYNQDEVLNHAVEFHGPGVATLSMSERFAIANMTTEWGALVGMFPCDERTIAYLRTCPLVSEKEIEEIQSLDIAPDAHAFYAKTLHLDLSEVSPSVSGPNEVKTMRSVAAMQREKIKIHKAYLVSCVNGRLEDIAEAADAIEGKRVADGVELYVAAASANVEQAAKIAGHWDKLEKAGAKFLPPGCGPCIGLGTGLLEDGEVGISATNRNFKGRMGSKNAQAYLASPAVVAASAAAGIICAPGEASDSIPEKKVEVNAQGGDDERSVSILEGFPASMVGEALYMPKDNMNTDGIYGKDVTYRDDMTPPEMAKAAFLNYDEKFQELGMSGDIIVGGKNFGTGSSREQAATALKFFGIQMVIAESFSQTYKRNAFNNGFICIECPPLVEALKKAFASNSALTIRTGWNMTVDFTAGKIRCDRGAFPFIPLGEVPQRLVMAGGAEAIAREQIADAGDQ